MTEDEKFVEEKFVEMILVFISLFYFVLLVPTIVDHFYEDRPLKERVITLECRIADLEKTLYDHVNG